MEYTNLLGEMKKTSRDALQRLKIAAIVIIVVVLLITILAMSINRYISKGFFKLAEFVTKIGHGDLDSTIEIDSSDEIGDMAKELNSTAKSLKEANIETQKLVMNLKNLDVPVMEIDREFNIVFMNNVGAAINKKDPEEIIGTKCYDHFNTSDCKTEKCACFQAMETGEISTSNTVACPLKSGYSLPITYCGDDN